MTTEARLQKALATLKSSLATMQRLAADHPDPNARGAFSDEARRLEPMLRRLEGHLRATRRREAGGDKADGAKPGGEGRAR